MFDSFWLAILVLNELAPEICDEAGLVRASFGRFSQQRRFDLEHKGVFPEIKQRMHTPLVFDGRNLYDPKVVRGHGFTYYGIGRGKSV